MYCNKVKLIIPIFLLFLLIVTGCAVGKKTAQKKTSGEQKISGCERDIDCGLGSCTDDRRLAKKKVCQDGKCQEQAVDCTEEEICLLDSTGVKCRNKKEVDDTPRDFMSCNANTGTLKTTGYNPFSVFDLRCSSDCPKDFVCDVVNCLCEPEPKPEEPPVPCPPLKFVSNREAKARSLNLPTEDLFDILDILISPNIQINPSETVNVPAFHNFIDDKTHYYPFPDRQFAVIPRDPAPRDAYCANDYYDGDKGLAINLDWVERPDGEYDFCRFGTVDAFSGILTVCYQDIFDWIYEIFNYNAD